MTERMIENRIQKLRDLEEQKKQLEKEIERIQKELKDEMNSQNVNELTGTSSRATWKQFITHRFDSKAFRADHNEMYQMYVKAIASQRFCIA